MVASECKKVNLDDVLVNFRVFGLYHVKLALLLILAYTLNGVCFYNHIFAATNVGYRCNETTDTCVLTKNNTLYDACFKKGVENDSVCSTDLDVERQACTEWVYDDPHSFVAEFDLACQDWKRNLVGTAHNVGYMVGLLVVGPFSDRIGRKNALIITGLIGGVIGLTKSFMYHFWVYIFLEFTEAAIGDNYSPMFMLGIEQVATKNRPTFYMITTFAWTFSGMLLAAWAYTFTYWRTYIRVIYAPLFILLTYIYLIDESPRWLLSKGRKDQAVEILEKAAKLNKLELNKDMIENLSLNKEKSIGLGALLKNTFTSNIILGRFLVCLSWWIACTFTSYGMTLNVVSLAGNKYLNFVFVSLTDIPASVISGYTLKHFKRKLSLCISFLIGAIFCLSQPFLPKNPDWLPTLLFMAGKCMASVYFNITYVYTSELFPTYTRNSMHALCSSIGRIGSVLAQQTPLLLVYWSVFPSLLFGIVAFIAALLTLLVPDTSKDALPDTVQQAEGLGLGEMKTDVKE